jgi:hypothetical protein
MRLAFIHVLLLDVRLLVSRHYRKHINFRGPFYFRRPAHENSNVIFVGLVTDENVAYFRGPGNIFVGRPMKILKLFSSASGPTKMWRSFVGRTEADPKSGPQSSQPAYRTRSFVPIPPRRTEPGLLACVRHAVPSASLPPDLPPSACSQPQVQEDATLIRRREAPARLHVQIRSPAGSVHSGTFPSDPAGAFLTAESSC